MSAAPTSAWIDAGVRAGLGPHRERALGPLSSAQRDQLFSGRRVDRDRAIEVTLGGAHA